MPSSFDINVQSIHFDCLNPKHVDLKMARFDQINKLASGNKIYKLKPVLNYVKNNNIKQVISFGGAYSNHIHALALLAEHQGIESIALIRGEPEYAKNPTLKDAQNAGMRLVFVDRAEYKQRNDLEYLAQLQKSYPNALIVPEGGSSQLAIEGCAQMARDINLNDVAGDNVLAVASGTGATAAGLTCGLAQNQNLNVYAVLKDGSLHSRINEFVRNEEADSVEKNYTIHQADFGGYAKLDKYLITFILNWLDQTGILLDPIYTSKMCCRVIQQIEAGDFEDGTTVTLIHSGGLQGWRGMQKRVKSLAGIDAWQKIESYLDSPL